MDTVRDKILNALTLFYQKIKSIFIQTTNVVNNCASTSTTYPLSAAQGTSLQGQIDDINSTLAEKLPNYRIRGGSKSVSVTSGETSAVLLTAAQLKSMFGVSSFESWRYSATATNGNGSTCNIHIHGTTILNNQLYVLFGSAAATAATLTVNYTIFYYGNV